MRQPVDEVVCDTEALTFGINMALGSTFAEYEN